MVGWDNYIGPIIEATYPSDITMDRERMLHYLMAIQTLGTSPIIQVQDNTESVLIYGIHTNKGEAGAAYNYNFIVLVLGEDELEKAGQFKLRLNTEGEKIINTLRTDRRKIFLDFARTIVQPPAHKIVFIGFSNAGKTSTRRFFFEKMQEEKLLNTTIEPTLGFETNYYHLMDLNLALFDTAGQELDRWYDESEPVLEGSDLVVFFFSVEDWKENAQKVNLYFQRLVQLKKKKADVDRNLIAFCHKFDLIKENQLEFKKQVIDFLQPMKIPVFFTSIVNGGNTDLIAGMQLLLMNYSRLIIDFNNLVNPLLKRFKLDPLFIIDFSDRILASYVKESEFPEIKHGQLKAFISNLTAKYSQVFEEKLVFASIWLNASKIFVICVNFSLIHEDLTYLFCKSDSLKTMGEFFESYQKLIQSYNWLYKNKGDSSEVNPI